MESNLIDGSSQGSPRGNIRREKALLSVSLRQNLFHYAAVYICEPEVSSLEAVGEPFVIETQQMQESGVKVMHVNFAVHYAEAQFVGLAVKASI